MQKKSELEAYVKQPTVDNIDPSELYYILPESMKGCGTCGSWGVSTRTGENDYIAVCHELSKLEQNGAVYTDGNFRCSLFSVLPWEMVN